MENAYVLDITIGQQISNLCYDKGMRAAFLVSKLKDKLSSGFYKNKSKLLSNLKSIMPQPQQQYTPEIQPSFQETVVPTIEQNIAPVMQSEQVTEIVNKNSYILDAKHNIERLRSNSKIVASSVNRKILIAYVFVQKIIANTVNLIKSKLEQKSDNIQEINFDQPIAAASEIAVEPNNVIPFSTTVNTVNPGVLDTLKNLMLQKLGLEEQIQQFTENNGINPEIQQSIVEEINNEKKNIQLDQISKTM